MMQTIYKILFEVRLLHEFYLTQQDGTVIFSKTDAADRDLFLQQFFQLSRRSINSDISYSVPDASLSFFGNHRLRLLETYSGFKIAIEVTRVTDGALTAFEPKVPLTPDASITVFVDRTGAAFDTYTNARRTTTLGGIVYLSNESTGAARTPPFLTNPVPAYDASYAYEQGELYTQAGKIKAFYPGIRTADPGLPGTAFVNETDRMVVLPSFDYTFGATDNIRRALFIIKDPAGVEVYRNTFTGDQPLQRVTLSLDPLKIKKLPHGGSTGDMLYKLTVTGDRRYKKTFPLLFLDTRSGASPWAVVNINPQPADAAFRIIDEKGLLLTRLNPDGSVNAPYPVFEVCIKSRLSYWKYVNNLGTPIKNLFPAILTAADGALMTQKPLFHSYLPVPVGGQRLPNPKPFFPLIKEGGRQSSVIIVPLSDPFPNGP